MSARGMLVTDDFGRASVLPWGVTVQFVAAEWKGGSALHGPTGAHWGVAALLVPGGVSKLACAPGEATAREWARQIARAFAEGTSEWSPPVQTAEQGR